MSQKTLVAILMLGRRYKDIYGNVNDSDTVDAGKLMSKTHKNQSGTTG